MIEAGAGRGRLAADVLAATPECAAALRYVLVERSPGLRAAQRDLLTVEPFEDALGPRGAAPTTTRRVPVAGMGPIVTALDELPAVPFDGVVLANELLDNLPFRIVERAADALVGGAGRRSTATASSRRWCPRSTSSRSRPTPSPPGRRCPTAPGCRSPPRSPTGCSGRASALHRGVLVVIDYAATAEELVARGADGWLRTYRDHGRGGAPLVAPGRAGPHHRRPARVPGARRGARRAPARATTPPRPRGCATLGVDELVADARARVGRTRPRR